MLIHKSAGSVLDPAVSAGGFVETHQGEIRFPEISTPILEKVCQYFYFKLRYKNVYVSATSLLTTNCCES